MPRAPRPEPPRALVVSAVPGRIRLRLPARRGDAGFFAALAAQALMLPGVTAASGNATTAGLLLRHRGEGTAVLEAAARERLFVAAPGAAAARGVAAHQGAALGAVALGGLAVLQALRGALLPPAATLLWYAGALLGRDGAGSGEDVA